MNYKELELYLMNNTFDVQTAKASFTLASVPYFNYAYAYNRHHVEFSPLFAYFNEESNIFSQITNSKFMSKLGRKLYSKYSGNSNEFAKMIKKSEDMRKSLSKHWNTHKLSSLSDKEMLAFYRKLIALSDAWWDYGILGEDHGDFINNIIVPDFAAKQGIPIEQTKETVLTLAHPDEQTDYMAERQLFLSMCIAVLNSSSLKKNLDSKNYESLKQDPKLKKMIAQYINDYFWFKTDFYSATEITSEYLFEAMVSESESHSLQEMKSELSRITEEFRQIQKKKKNLFSKLKLSQKDKKSIEFAELFILWIDKRKHMMMNQFYYILTTLRTVAKRLAMPYDDLMRYSCLEAEELLSNNKKLSDDELARRRTGFFSVFEKGKKVKMFYGDEGKKLYEIATRSEQEEIKGMVASKGISGNKTIKGFVRIVFHPEKDDFSEGEILVTPMTRVEFVPLMRRAKAIITDEGGVACHAAIVSRELGIPCIIGTRNASKMLKNGDLVEIDVEKGIVRKIR